MFVLGGDTHFNKWNARTIPHHKIKKCIKSAHARIFQHDDGAEFYDPPEGHGPQMYVGASGVDEEHRMPFPQGHRMLLGQEMICVFDAEVIVVLKPRAGEMLKAVLVKHIWAVAVFRDEAHQDIAPNIPNIRHIEIILTIPLNNDKTQNRPVS